MSTSLLARATAALKAKHTGLQKKRAENQKEEEMLFTGVATLGGAGVGAFIDTKGQNGGPHKLFQKADGTGGLPTNVAAGVPLAVAAIAVKKFPLRMPVAALGLSLAGVGLYRYIVDKHAAKAAAAPHS